MSRGVFDIVKHLWWSFLQNSSSQIFYTAKYASDKRCRISRRSGPFITLLIYLIYISSVNGNCLPRFTLTCFQNHCKAYGRDNIHSFICSDWSCMISVFHWYSHFVFLKDQMWGSEAAIITQWKLRNLIIAKGLMLHDKLWMNDWYTIKFRN